MGHLVKHFAECQFVMLVCQTVCQTVMPVCFLLSKSLPDSCISVTSCVFAVDILDRKPCCTS